MDGNPMQLRLAIIATVTLLQQPTQALDARVQAAQALLLAALVLADAPPVNAAPPAGDFDLARVNAALDPATARLRDQLAVTLGLEWQVVAAIMPPPVLQPVALPPRPDAPPPAKPWCLVDAVTKHVIAGPSTARLPANALYLQHPLTTAAPDLVVLCDSQYREDDQLPAAWFTTDHRGTSDSEDEEDADYDDEEPPVDDGAAERQAELDALVRVYGYAHCV